MATVSSISGISDDLRLRVERVNPGPSQRVLLEQPTTRPLGNGQLRVAISESPLSAVVPSGATFRRYFPGLAESADFGDSRNLRDLKFDFSGRLWAVGSNLLSMTFQDQFRMSNLADVATSLDTGEWGCLTGLRNGSFVRHLPNGDFAESGTVAAEAITAIASDGHKKVFGTVNGAIIVAEADGSLETIRAAHTDQINAVAIAADGRFVRGGADRVVRLWSQTNELLCELPQSRPVRRVFLTADDSRLKILAEGERAVRQWNLNAATVPYGRLLKVYDFR